ncbi:MAG TPA: hypothetical protein VL096_06920, partial [Pirellulaceae bacterium]|nr:hypothetical protein [Pirellulaceae bacterium]
GPGSQVQSDRALYPSKQELMSALEGCHIRAAAAVREAAPELFALPNPSPRPQLKMLETIGHVVTLLLTTHESVHLGQLSFWRRAVGLPALF